MQIVFSLLALMVMIPAGLAGIAAALQGIPAPVGELFGTLEQVWIAGRELAPWCQPLACGLLGLGLLAASFVVAWRGLQSRT
ncbi:MAG: hypothetical protein EA370_08770 [Wenzhouxiangella sp.]|nr:MAG: hypothetical protein EA370_08770 [Wenzhouxiangella sp.]